MDRLVPRRAFLLPTCEIEGRAFTASIFLRFLLQPLQALSFALQRRRFRILLARQVDLHSQIGGRHSLDRPTDTDGRERHNEE